MLSQKAVMNLSYFNMLYLNACTNLEMAKGTKVVDHSIDRYFNNVQNMTYNTKSQDAQESGQRQKTCCCRSKTFFWGILQKSQ